jgi:hypothetical protein
MGVVAALENRIYVEIKIQDEPLPKTSNLIEKISIHESVNAITPTMQLTLYDTSGSTINKLALTEGTQVSILCGKYETSAKLRKFRLFGFKQSTTREGPKVIANFILDAPEYITQSKTESFKDKNSSDVISDMASKCELKPDVETTSDKMTWLNFGQTRAAFAEDVALHGYTGESSCMMRALTSEKVLRYKDVMKELNSTEPKVTLAVNTSEGSGTVIQVRETRNVSVSGAMNNYMNYGWIHPTHSLKGKEVKHEKYKAQTTNPHLPINSDVKSKISDKTRIEYSTKLDCRNSHDNYVKARYNNMRGRALLGERMHVLIEEPSDLQLLDTVEFKQIETDGSETNTSGKYLVTAKVIYITNGSFYYEKLEIVRNSLKEAGNTPLASE